MRNIKRCVWRNGREEARGKGHHWDTAGDRVLGGAALCQSRDSAGGLSPVGDPHRGRGTPEGLWPMEEPTSEQRSKKQGAAERNLT